MRKIAACVSVVLALVLPVNASAATGPVDAWVAANGASAGRGILNETGKGQVVPLKARPGRDVYADAWVTNHTSHDVSLTLAGSPGGPRFGVTYRDDRWNDITPDVLAGTYQLPVRAGKTAELTIQVRATTTDDTGDQRRLWLDATDPASGATDRIGVHAVVPAISIWATNYSGTLRCTATFPHRVYAPGQRLHVRMAVTNLTKQTIQAGGAGPAYLIVRDAAGTVLANTNFNFFSRPPFFLELRPGQTKRVWTMDTAVRWNGPISVQPVCGSLKMRMGRATLAVDAPGPTPSAKDAVKVAASAFPDGPFASCVPRGKGAPVTATFSTPDGRKVPPMTVRCWAHVDALDGFDVVNLYMVSPDDAPAYELGDDPWSIDDQITSDTPNFLAERWALVVTPDGTRPFRTVERYRAYGTGKGVYEYENTKGHEIAGGWSTCGVDANGVAVFGTVVMLALLTGCDQSAGSTTQAVRRIELVPGDRRASITRVRQVAS
jgi:hypothetical protein